MTYQPISGAPPQYSNDSNELASGFYLKFYESNTTTPLPMATDTSAGTLLAKCKLNPDGFPISNPLDNDTVFIPHVNQGYRLVIYRNEADADANNTAAAFYNIPEAYTPLGILTSSDPGEGASLVSMEGGPTVEEAVSNRVIRVSSRTEMKGYDVPAGYQFSLEEGGRSGIGVVKSGTPPSDPQEGFYVVLNNGNYWERINKYPATPEMFGALFDGSDDSAAWNGLASVIDAGATVSSSTPGGTSTCNSDVTFTKNVIFEMPNVTVFMNGGSFNVNGSYAEITATLSANADEGDTTLSVTDSSEFAVGDLFVIHDTADFSFSAHRAAYQKGEFIEITATGTGTIDISDALQDDYTASASLKFFKISPVKVETKGLNFAGPGSFAIANIDLARDVYFENVDANGGTDRAVEFRRCFGVRVEGGSYEHREPDTLGTHYGISIANCQNVVLRPKLAFGTRHGVTTGGYNSDCAIVNRDVFIQESVVSNNNAIYAADLHGNSENCWYENCTITNRAGIAGKNCGVRGGTIDGVDNDQRVMAWQEVVAGDIVYEDVRVIVRGLNTAFGYTAESIMADVEQNFRNVLRNVVIDYRGSRANPGIFGNFADGAKVTEWSVVMENVKYIDAAGVINRVASFAVSNPSSFATAPVAAKRVYVDNIEVPDISNLVLWVSRSGGAIDSGTTITLPDVMFASDLTILTGNSDSADYNITYPDYLEVPHIGLASDRVAVGSNYYAVPVTTTSTSSAATLRLSTLNASNTVASDRTARLSAIVSLKNYLIP